MKLQSVKKTFIQGLLTILPLAVTIYVLYWLIVGTEQILKSVITTMLPEGYYLPGLGLILGLVVIYFAGLVTSLWIGQKIVSFGENLLERVPLVKTIYGSMKDLFSYFNVSNDNELNKPALIEYPELNAKLLGFVTQSEASKLPNEIASADNNEEVIAVYLPMSYQIGGFTVFVPRSQVTTVDLTIEEAMKFIITAGVSRRKS